MAKVAFLFPGQGAQKVGMGRQLHEALPAAKKLFDEAAEVLGYSLADVCFNGPPDRLNSTVISQPALFVCALAALESLRTSDPDAEKDCVAAGRRCRPRRTPRPAAWCRSSVSISRTSSNSATRLEAATSFRSPTCSARETSSSPVFCRPARPSRSSPRRNALARCACPSPA